MQKILKNQELYSFSYHDEESPNEEQIKAKFLAFHGQLKKISFFPSNRKYKDDEISSRKRVLLLRTLGWLSGVLIGATDKKVRYRVMSYMGDVYRYLEEFDIAYEYYLNNAMRHPEIALGFSRLARVESSLGDKFSDISKVYWFIHATARELPAEDADVNLMNFYQDWFNRRFALNQSTQVSFLGLHYELWMNAYEDHSLLLQYMTNLDSAGLGLDKIQKVLDILLWTAHVKHDKNENWCLCWTLASLFVTLSYVMTTLNMQDSSILPLKYALLWLKSDASQAILSKVMEKVGGFTDADKDQFTKIAMQFSALLAKSGKQFEVTGDNNRMNSFWEWNFFIPSKHISSNLTSALDEPISTHGLIQTLNNELSKINAASN